ncbi:hypothetical protein JHK86_044773 [Glycine max]|nr:hypothetical protein JHK86_044773 [Glycine max]
MEFVASSSSFSQSKPSSSFSKSKPKRLYDVFINFRGEDTRGKFVSHLHYALSKAGVNTFIDDENLLKGMTLKDELMRAIEGSQISLVVFSKSYTESTWCLDELEKILECRKLHDQIVMPIFYDIEPSVVRHQKGAFGKALKSAVEKTYSGEHAEQVLWRWSSALNRAADLSGFHVVDRRNEAILVKEIVEDVLRKLVYEDLYVTEFPVGLESRVQKVIGLINNQFTKVCMIGIWGMGGLGKTSTAKGIYNQIHRKFIDKSFIEDIREICQTEGRGHILLQKKLLSDVLKTEVDILSVGMGKTTIKERLSGKRMLVVLDDVNELGQVEHLCGNREWFGQGTVIIITTRDVRLLKQLKVDSIYKLEEMDKNESLELFSWHAFGNAEPREDFKELARSVVAYCGGLPLALRVLGAYLIERPKQLWESVLSKLEKIPNDQVQKKLRISFDGLSDPLEKDIFLDVCCFFIGKDRGYVTEILNGCGLHADIGITVLLERSLIKVEKNNKLGMHPLLRDMGREIICESSRNKPGKRSRLWFQKDVLDVLTKNTGTETIVGLALKLHYSSRDCFNAYAFKEMKSLRLLQLDHVHITGDYQYLSKQLRWVCWQGFPSKYIPNNFNLEGVIAIDLKHSNLRLVWKKPQVLQWLKILNLSHSKYLTATPNFSGLPSLEKLILKDCPSLSKNNDLGDLVPVLTNLSNLRSVLVQCDTEAELSKQLGTILDDAYGVNFTELEITSDTSQISKHYLKSYLIGIGSYQEYFNTLSDSISEVPSLYLCLLLYFFSY